MEPKDLKNSDELKSTLHDDTELSNEIHADAAEEMAEEIVSEAGSAETEQSEYAEVVEKVENTEVTVVDDLLSEVQETEVADVVEEVKPDMESSETAGEIAAVVESAGMEATEVSVPVAEESQVTGAGVPEPGEAVAEASPEGENELVPDEELPAAEAAAEVPDAGAVIEPVSGEEVQQAEYSEVSSGEESELTDTGESQAFPAPESEETPLVEEIENIDGQVVEETLVAEEKAEAAGDIVKTGTGELPPEPEEATHEQEVEELLERAEVAADQSIQDYSSLTQIELVNMMRESLDEVSADQEDKFEIIVAAYYRKTREINDELKKKFIAEGGVEDNFTAEEDPYKNDVRELLKKYRQIRSEQAKKLDAEKEINLQKKYEIIEEIKNLLNKEESINRTFQEFRDLQKHWYEIGQVPQSKMKDLWDTYHFHVENFYDYIKINKELRDLDLKKNLEAKIEICEKTEELLMEPSVIKAFNSLQKFHEQWREIGPVPTDKKDDIWERFKAATSKINLKHQDYFEKRKLEQKKNLDAKVALCEKAEEISLENYQVHKQWEEKSRELVELQKVWKTIGFAPKKENNRIYDRFRAACDKFFINKREFYSKNKDYQQTNLQMKIDLCMEAENLKESTDWKKATQEFIDLQKRWKEIGAVPRKSSDAIWKRFRAACDYFFERKSGHFSDIDEEQAENLKQKEQLISEVENFKADSDPAASLKMLREFQRRWTEIGHVPLKYKDGIQHRFREAIDKQFDALKIDNSNRTTFNFRSKIESMTDNARGLSKVRSEREKYMIKLKQLENDLILLDNNIGFFANSKNAQALIADVNQKIQDTRDKIEQLKEKIRIIDDLDKSEY